MKKFFLIPVLLLFLSVNMWGAMTRDQLATAISNASAGGTVTLTDDVTGGGSITISKNLTIDGNGHSMNQYIVVSASKTLTLKNITVSNINQASSGARTVALGNKAIHFVKIDFRINSAFNLIDFVKNFSFVIYNHRVSKIFSSVGK